MPISLRHPFVGHAAIFGALIASIGIVHVVYVDPRAREAQTLQGEQRKLEGQLQDLQRGLQSMEAWQHAHPGVDASGFSARRALPARDMVASFLRDVTPIANRWKMRTELIQPAGLLSDVTTTDAAGRSETYRKAELRFRLRATYRALGEYLGEVEAMEQLVVVRSVAVRYEAPIAPELEADVTIWLYGTP